MIRVAFCALSPEHRWRQSFSTVSLESFFAGRLWDRNQGITSARCCVWSCWWLTFLVVVLFNFFLVCMLLAVDLDMFAAVICTFGFVELHFGVSLQLCVEDENEKWCLQTVKIIKFLTTGEILLSFNWEKQEILSSCSTICVLVVYIIIVSKIIMHISTSCKNVLKHRQSAESWHI